MTVSWRRRGDWAVEGGRRQLLPGYALQKLTAAAHLRLEGFPSNDGFLVLTQGAPHIQCF
jgi:hypothetical protein